MTDLQNMTVVALRQFAKDNQIKLGTGLSKAEIITKIESALKSAKPTSNDSIDLSAGGTQSDPSKENPVSEETDDVSDIPPIKPGPHNDIVYSAKPAWQAKPVAPKPTRSAPSTVYQSRFGPSAATPPARFGPGSPAAAPAQTTFSPPPRFQPPQTNYSRQDPSLSSVQGSGRQSERQDSPAFPNPPKSIAGPLPSFAELTSLESLYDGKGILEVLPDGFGFLRDDTFSSSPKDIYVSNAQIKRFSLRTGDQVEGKIRTEKDGERYNALLYITNINGLPAEEQVSARSFYDLTPIYPDTLIPLNNLPADFSSFFTFSSYFSPIGYGQRALVSFDEGVHGAEEMVAASRAFTISSHTSSVVIGLFFSQTPEDSTLIKESFQGEAFVSTFDQPPDAHVRMAELLLGRAQRQAAQGKNVLLIVDNIGALTAAYQGLSMQNIRGSALALSPGALSRTLKLFGSGRNIREKGSLTIIASYYLSADPLSVSLQKELLKAANCHIFPKQHSSSSFIYLDCLKGQT
ncbi:MAG: hypothetical protein GX786_03940, partial [Clostridiales bacterium]|nr:hypothetical protein [Clostridiales bacterium]